MPPTEDVTPRWGFPDIAVAFLVGIVATAVFQTGYAVAFGLEADDLRSDALSMAETVLFQVPFWAGILGVPLVATGRRGNGPVRDLGLSITWRDAPLGLVIGVLCQFPLTPLVSFPFVWLFDRDLDELERPARELADKATGGGVVLLVLMVVVAAPVAEEVFYRGLVQRTIARHLPIWPAMLLTATVFGASHFQLLQFPALAVFGLVLSYLAHRTGRLGLSIWAHVGFNATTVVILLSTA